jgi:phage-related holin
MAKVFDNWYNFLLSIFFWIFIWRLFDLILNELNLTDKHKIVFYSISALILGILITYDKKFFKLN